MEMQFNLDNVEDNRLIVHFDDNKKPIVNDDDKKAIKNIDYSWSNGDHLYIKKNEELWEIIATRKTEMSGMEKIRPSTWRYYKAYFMGDIPKDIIDMSKRGEKEMDNKMVNEENTTAVDQLMTDIAPIENDETDYSGKMSDDLKKLHGKSGLHVRLNKIDQNLAMILVNTLIAALWNGIIYVLESIGGNNLLNEIRVFDSEEKAEKYIEQKSVGVGNLVKYGMNDEEAGEDKVPVYKIDCLFEKMGKDMCGAYEAYLKKWEFKASSTDGRTDIEDKRHAREMVKIYMPVTNEEGMLVLCRDSQGNQIFAYPRRTNMNGGIEYGVFRVGKDGNVSKSKIISASDAASSSNKLMKFVKDAEGDFSSRSALEAAYRLWLWNLSRQFECVHEDYDDYSLSAIRKFLLEWIENGIDMKIKKNEGEYYIVFCERIKSGEIKVGIWQDDLESVFAELNICNIPPTKWINEAAKCNWIECIYASNNGTGTLRRSYNPSEALRKEYKRGNKSERVFIFNIAPEIKEKLYEIRENAKKDNTVEEEKGK